MAWREAGEGRQQYNSILELQLRMQMEQQAQEKAEALQREQISDAKQQTYLNQMNQVGRLYFETMRHRDQEDRKRADQELAYQRGLEKEVREREAHKADLTLKYGEAEKTREDVQSFQIEGREDVQKHQSRLDLTFEQQLALEAEKAKGRGRGGYYPRPPSPSVQRNERLDQIKLIKDDATRRTKAWDEASDEFKKASESRTGWKEIKSFTTGKAFRDKQEMMSEMNMLNSWIADVDKTLGRASKHYRKGPNVFWKEMEKLQGDVNEQIDRYEGKMTGRRAPDAGVTPQASGSRRSMKERLAARRGGGTAQAAPAAQAGIPTYAESFGVNPDPNSPEFPQNLQAYYLQLLEMGLSEEEATAEMQQQGLI